MISIPASTNNLQEDTVPQSHYPIAKEDSANRQSEDQAQQDRQDHESEEETRRRLEEWRCMATNLTGGFTQMPDQVRKDPTLSSNAKLVYEHLLGYMWSKEWCWPSQQTIADGLGISRRTVIRACKELSRRMYIEKWRRGLGRTNVYFINPLSIVLSTGIKLTEINLPLPSDMKDDAPLAALYGTRFYASDFSNLEKCQNGTSRSDTMALPDAPNWHSKHTKDEENTKAMDRYSNDSSLLEKGTVLSTPGAIRREQQNTILNEKKTKNNQEPNIVLPTKTKNKPNDLEKAAPPRAKAIKEVRTEQKLSAEAQVIAASTGIPASHLAELGIAQEPRKRPIPDFITRMMNDFTRDLGDSPRCAKSNATRAAKIYYFSWDYIQEAQEDPEGWFIDMLYEAKTAAQHVNGVRKRTGNRINRVPVFFACLENRFEFTPDELAFLRSDLALYEPEDR